MLNLFLTGEIQIGKSTILKNILERLNASIGGYITERVVHGNTMSFVIQSLYDGKTKYPIAVINRTDNNGRVFIDSFKTGIIDVLNNSLEQRDIIVLDELGFMENDVVEFTSKIHEILDSEKIALGVLKKHNCTFVKSIIDRDDTMIIEVTKENRNFLLNHIIEILKTKNLPLKKDSLLWDPDKIHWYNEALDHPLCTYPKAFIEEIKKYTGELAGKSILDIGAGSGAFSIPLAKEGAIITAVDSSFNMMHSLMHRAYENNLSNINCIISPFDKANVPKHDFAISAFSGNSTKSPETLARMCNLADAYSFMISSFENHRISFEMDVLHKMLGRTPYRKCKPKKDISCILKMLDQLDYKYDYKQMEYELSQYFKGFNEAIDFFTDRLDITEKKEIEIVKEFLDQYLDAVGNEYVFRNINTAYLLTINSPS